jgi:hypothetical protein
VSLRGSNEDNYLEAAPAAADFRRHIVPDQSRWYKQFVSDEFTFIALF